MQKQFDPKRTETLSAESPEMAEAVKGYKMVVPQIEYRNRMTINLGERTFELIYLKNVHSEADTAVWLPKERVLFAASAANQPVPMTSESAIRSGIMSSEGVSGVATRVPSASGTRSKVACAPPTNSLCMQEV